MLTSKTGLTAVTLFTTTALFAAPAMASTANFETDSASAEIAVFEVAPIESDAAPVQPEDAAILDQATPTELEIAASDAGTLAIARASAGAELGKESLAGDTDAPAEFELSGNVALVSDYRFRGVSFSDGDPALQGGIDLAHSSGLYLGTWASSISGGTPYGELELDIYAGWSGEVSEGVGFDIGLLYYIYPTETGLANALSVETDYFEPYASISYDLGPVSTTVGVAYAWDQASIGNDDNLYIYTDFEAGIPDTPLTLSAHIGYTDGVFSTDTNSTSFDWGLGASYAITDSLSLGLNYVDTQGPSVKDFTDSGFFVTLGYSM